MLRPLVFLVHVSGMPEEIKSFLNMIADKTKVLQEVWSDGEWNMLQKA